MFYGISTFEDYLVPNPVLYIYVCFLYIYVCVLYIYVCLMQFSDIPWTLKAMSIYA